MPKISPKVQRRISLLVSAIALGAVAWWVSKQDAPRFPESWTGYLWMLGALAIYALALTARGWRWHRILRVADTPHERADAYRLKLVGYMGNNVLPARGGEALRIGQLGSLTTALRRTILGSIVAERMLDAGVLAAIFAPLTWAGGALASYLALRRRGRFARFHERVRLVTRALKIFAHGEGLLLATLSVAVWCCEGLTLLLIGHSLGLDLHFLDSTLVIVLASLFAVVPAAPGYAGTFDGA